MTVRRWRILGLAGTVALATLMTATAITNTFGALRLIVGLVIVFGLSGNAVLYAVLPRLSLSPVERCAASLGLSFVVAITSWVLVGSTPLGVTRTTTSVTLGAITALAALSGLARSRDASDTAKDLPRTQAAIQSVGSNLWIGIRRAHHQSRFWWLRCSVVGVAVVLVWASIDIATTATLQAERSGSSALWLVPVRSNEVSVGVTSHQDHPHSFRLALDVDGTPVDVWRKIQLNPGQTWSKTIAIATTPPAPKIQANLTVTGSSAPPLSADLQS